jgi:hypothetical protein
MKGTCVAFLILLNLFRLQANVFFSKCTLDFQKDVATLHFLQKNYIATLCKNPTFRNHAVANHFWQLFGFKYHITQWKNRTYLVTGESFLQAFIRANR